MNEAQEKEIAENLSPEGISELLMYWLPSLMIWSREIGSYRSWDAWRDCGEVVVECSTLADAGDVYGALETRLYPFRVTVAQEGRLVSIAAN